MNKTKIDWADMTWNPVTGCLHECPYCYAKKVARRFAPASATMPGGKPRLHVLEERKNVGPFPCGFEPTFHRCRLTEPGRRKLPCNIFVCSMSDLFGAWVPTDWIVAVLDACLAAPQHNYMFLTKNPQRYLDLDHLALLPRKRNFWYGTTVTAEKQPYFFSGEHNTFVSVEPMHGPLRGTDGILADWVIVGAETGKRDGKILPRREWVLDLAEACGHAGVPIFMKENLVKEGALQPGEIIRRKPEGLKAWN